MSPLPVRRPEAHYHPAYYVPRAELERPDLEDHILDELDAKGILFVCGPPGFGKTYFWHNLLDRLKYSSAEPSKMTVVRIDLRASIHTAGKSPDTLLAEIISPVAERLGIDGDVKGLFPKSIRPDWTLILTTWVERRVLPIDDRRIVLALDCPATKDGSLLQKQLYDRLCSWPSRSEMWLSGGRIAKIAVLVAHTTTYCEKDDFIDPLPGWCKWFLPSFTPSQAATFLKRFGNWPDRRIHDLRFHLDTHPYLLATAAYLMHRKVDPLSFEQVEQLAIEASGLFREYLDDVFKDLDHNPDCKEAIRSVLRGSTKRLPPAVARKLERAGILVERNGRHGFRFRIVETYLRGRFQ